MKIALLLLLLTLTGCTVKPTIRSGQTVVTLGGSIFTKTSGEVSSYSGPLGNLNYATTSTDETVVPGKLINYYGIKAVTAGLTSGLRTTESTKRILAKEETSRAATKSAAASTDLKTLNPVEETILE